nr:DUF2336 domain-containing protein [uncultured Cohaesibacter sp.]
MGAQISQTLESLARETDPEARSLLIRKVTAEYVRRISHTPTELERNLFSALVMDLYDHISISVRRDIITLLAQTTHITAELAERLSQEADEHVVPLFEHSPLLGLDKLIAASRKRDEDVLKAIARRTEVPETLVDALMARAFVGVVEELVRNIGAVFSQQAMTFCSIVGQSSPQLQALIAERCLKDQAFHDSILHSLADGCPFVPMSIVKASEDGSLDEVAFGVGAKANMKPANDLSEGPVNREEATVQINLGELTYDELLRALLRAERKEDILWLLSDRPGLSTKAMEHLLSTEGNRTLLRILVEQDVSLQTFEALMKWRVKHFKFLQRNVYREVEQFRQNLRQKHSA